jgi:ABC-2 type transport system ATP-binding protein
MAAIEVRDLIKNYKGVQALKGVTLSVEKGEIYGLLGRNGAGKTTLVKILLSIVRAGGGEARLLDRKVPDAASRQRVGYLPEDHRFPEYHTAESALDFYGSLYEMPGDERRRRIPELLARMELSDAARRKVRTYSKGMKQRLGLAQAILHDPDVIFLDEPTDGVDPVGRKQIRDILMELKARGKTIFLNSHLLSEVELICDRVGILDLGKLLREGSVESLTRTENAYEIRVEGPAGAAWDDLLKLAPDARKTGDAIQLTLVDPKKLDAVLDLLRSRGVHVRGFLEKKRSLEDIFIDTVSEKGAG